MDNNDVTTAVEQMKINFHHRYSHLSWEDVEYIYQKALGYYLSLAFPLRHDLLELPASRIGDLRLIREVMENGVERLGISSLTAYSENGMSYTFDSSMFDSKFISMIIPEGKVIVF